MRKTTRETRKNVFVCGSGITVSEFEVDFFFYKECEVELFIIFFNP